MSFRTRIITLALCAALLFPMGADVAFASGSAETIDFAISFMDPGIEKLVRMALKRESGAVTLTDMQSIRSLPSEEALLEALPGSGTGYYVNWLRTASDLFYQQNDIEISSVEDLFWCTSLETLAIKLASGCDIQRLAQVRKLKNLYLSGKLPSDFWPLYNLRDLSWLIASEDAIGFWRIYQMDEAWEARAGQLDELSAHLLADRAGKSSASPNQPASAQSAPIASGATAASADESSQKYSHASALLDEGDYRGAYLAFRELYGYSDSLRKSCQIANQYLNADRLCAGSYHTAGLRTDGTILVAGMADHFDVSDLNGVTAISAGNYFMIGLNSDGTVRAAGMNDFGQMDTDSWRDIVAIATGYSHTVGLKADGTVIAVGSHALGQINVGEWRDIVAVAAGGNQTLGLRANGTVIGTGDNQYGQLNVEDWSDIIAIAAGDCHTVGLKADGTVVAVGSNSERQLNVGDWSEITDIAAGRYHTVGLKANGTLLAVGYSNHGQMKVKNWKDVIAIAVGTYHTLGLLKDGSVVAVGWNEYGQINVSDWNLFNAESSR